MSLHGSQVSVVVTCFNQGEYVRQAVQSVRAQTLPAASIIVVDDGSDDVPTLRALDELGDSGITVLHQSNRGQSAARNAAIASAETDLVAVLDGDDRLAPTFLERTVDRIGISELVLAASSWMQTFGVLDAVVKPTGGDIAAFLAHNCAPATCLLQRNAWERSGGYDETMRSGFEDWDCYLGLLESGGHGCRIEIVPEPLIEYRTAPASLNVTSMNSRLDLMRGLIEKHHDAYGAHVAEALLGVEATSICRLDLWERTVLDHPELLQECEPVAEFMRSPTFGDGGMAAAVRIASHPASPSIFH